MTRDEARALIAEQVAHWAVVGPSRAARTADEILDALFAQGGPEYRVVGKDGCPWSGMPMTREGAKQEALDADCWGGGPHRVQVRRVVFVSDEWRDETDG